MNETQFIEKYRKVRERDPRLVKSIDAMVSGMLTAIEYNDNETKTKEQNVEKPR